MAEETVTPVSPENEGETTPGNASATLPSPFNRKRRRLAEKLFLSYVLPLAVLIVAGIMLPVLLWSYLGRAEAEYDQRASFREGVERLRDAAVESENQVRGYILYGDSNFLQEFTRARDQVRNISTELYEKVDPLNSPGLRDLLDKATNGYNTWRRVYVQQEIAAGRERISGTSDPRQAPHVVRATRMRVGFVSVRANMDLLLETVTTFAREQRDRAEFSDLLRRIVVVAIPCVSVLLSILIGRSIALGITRPLENLTQATQALERGDANPLVVAEDIGTSYADDEIGELQWAFQQMARTIGQREAVLRAQNETLGALNRRVEAVLNATNDGIVLLDRTGAFAVVNNRFAELFGLEPDVLIDQPYQQAAPLLLSRFRNRAEVRQRLEAIVNDPTAFVEEVFEVAEPVVRVLRVYSSPVQRDQEEGATVAADNLLGRIFVFRDVTRETTVDRMKTEFVATVSHELRTPLTAIKGYVDLMLEGKPGTLTETQADFLKMTRGSTERLTALINDMLDISKIESGRMDMRQESVDYVPLAEQAIRLLQREADERHIQLILEVGSRGMRPVLGDGDRITQVLVNFISNGIKYSPNGGEVRVIIEQESDFVTTCIADTGIGISREDQPRLFQKFFRADNSTTRSTGGTGLGLAITRAILEKLGGSVWVESAPGKGSKFWFTLPVATESDSVPMEPPNATPAMGDQTLILSIDSDPATLHRLGHELRHQGFITSAASTPGEALRRAKGLRPDMITLDLLTSGFDAFALLGALRQNPVTATIPVALVGLHTIGARIELSDSRLFLPYSQQNDTLREAIWASLGPKVMDDAPTSSRTSRPVTLVVGDASLAEATRQALAGTQIVVVAATTPEDADNRVSGLFPDLVVIDNAAAQGTSTGAWIARLKNRRPGVRLPVVVLTDDAILSGDTAPLVPLNTGGASLEKMGPLIWLRLRQKNAAGNRAKAAAAEPASTQ